MVGVDLAASRRLGRGLAAEHNRAGAEGVTAAATLNARAGAPNAVTGKDATVNGIRYHYAEAGTGPLVVLLHGVADLGHSWRYQLPALAAAGYRAVAPDLRGCGGSEVLPRVED